MTLYESDANRTKPGPERFAAVDGLVRKWIEDVSEHVCTYPDVTDQYARIDPIEHESYSGFIAFTNGGYDAVICADMGTAHGSGSIPGWIEAHLEADLKECANAWDRQNPDCTYATIFTNAPVGEWQSAAEERYWEWEHDWLCEGGTYFYKVRALYYAQENNRSESGHDEIHLCCGICTDFEYGRDKGTQWLWDCDVRADQLTPEMLPWLIDLAAAGMDTA